MWCVSVRSGPEVVGVALVGHPAQEWMEDDEILSVLRVAVKEGYPNACSMLYGACSRAARAMGARSLVTYTHADEPGASLKAAGWKKHGRTEGGEHSRESRPRKMAVDPSPKDRWFAPWSHLLTKTTASPDGDGSTLSSEPGSRPVELRIISGNGTSGPTGSGSLAL
jgi:hypothetical protein